MKPRGFSYEQCNCGYSVRSITLEKGGVYSKRIIRNRAVKPFFFYPFPIDLANHSEAYLPTYLRIHTYVPTCSYNMANNKAGHERNINPTVD